MSEALRVCLAVALAAGLLGAAGPAMQDAKLARSDAAARTAVQTLADTVDSLVASSDPVPLGVGRSAATRTVSLDLPGGSATVAGPVTLLVGRPAAGRTRWDAVGYRIATQPPRWFPVPVDVRIGRGTSTVTDREALEIHGDATLVLRYVRVDGRPTVLVSVADRGRAFK